MELARGMLFPNIRVVVYGSFVDSKSQFIDGNSQPLAFPFNNLILKFRAESVLDSFGLDACRCTISLFER